MIYMGNKDYENALATFIEAHKVVPKNREIVFYKSSAMIMVFLDVIEKNELSLTQIKTYFKSIIKEYDVGIRQHKIDHFLYFYRGLLYLYTREFDNALNDLERAVKNNEEANAKYHMFRGLTYACLSMFKEAMKDLSSAIKLKEDYMLAYYNRGKCAYLIGDTDLAFSDFQKLLLLKPVFFYFHTAIE